MVLNWFRKKPAALRQYHSVIFEVTNQCNLDCSYCYNVWNGSDYPRGQLDTRATCELMGRIVDGTGCRLLTLTGGEPLLRQDLEQLVAHAADLGVSCNLITNGTLLTQGRAGRLVEAGVGLFETPLLGADRRLAMELHGRDVLSSTQEAIVTIVEAGGAVVTAFVATRRNIDSVQDAVELSFALGASGMMFNRFNPGGRGGANAEELMPTPQQLERALSALDQFVGKTGFPVNCSIPIHPCILETSSFTQLNFGFCAAATDRAYYTFAPLGNLRMCNHSPAILGNIFEEDFQTMTTPDRTRFFLEPVPEMCRGCRRLDQCRCGCRAGAESCYGDLGRPDPYLARYGRGPITEV